MSNCPNRHRADLKYTARQLKQLRWATLLFVFGLVLFLIGWWLE